MNHDAEQIRDEILQAILRLAPPRSAKPYVGPYQIAQVVGEDLDILYHLEILSREGYVELMRTHDGTSARLTSLGTQRVREGVRPGTSSSSITHIGLSIGSVHGTSIQMVGTASDSQISQGGNDLSALSSQLDEIKGSLTRLLSNELSAKDLADYQETFEALRAELQSARPRESAVTRLLAHLSFLADTEGSIALYVRVASTVATLGEFAAKVMGH